MQNYINKYKFINLVDMPSIRDEAAEWFHSKWGVPTEAYLNCIEKFLNGETDYGCRYELFTSTLSVDNIKLYESIG